MGGNILSGHPSKAPETQSANKTPAGTSPTDLAVRRDQVKITFAALRQSSGVKGGADKAQQEL